MNLDRRPPEAVNTNYLLREVPKKCCNVSASIIIRSSVFGFWFVDSGLDLLWDRYANRIVSQLPKHATYCNAKFRNFGRIKLYNIQYDNKAFCSDQEFSYGNFPWSLLYRWPTHVLVTSDSWVRRLLPSSVPDCSEAQSMYKSINVKEC